MAIEDIANLNYLATILAMNLVGFLFFYFSPARQDPILKESVSYFMLMFALISVAFITFTSRIFISPAISLGLANGLFVLSVYAAKNGFISRSGRRPKSLLKIKTIWVNIAILTLLNVGGFYFYIDNFAIRATLTSVNIAAVFLSCISHISKDNSAPTDGERIAKIAIASIALFTPSSAVLFWLEPSFFAYMSALMFTQAIGVTGLIGAFLTLIMSGVINDYYQSSVTDPLTKVYNRRFFMESAKKQERDADKSKHSALILADIDDFKKINDEHGHVVGDQVLVSFAEALNSHLRATDIVARFGGEEFAIFLPNSSIPDAKILAERLCDAVSSFEVNTDKGNINVSASFGVAKYDSTESLEKSLQHADEAMYNAKRTGKNRVVLYEGC